MGVAGFICRAILGPILVYLILWIHMVYHIGFKEPNPLSVPSWPAAANAKDKEAIIAARKPVIREFMDFVGGKNPEFFKQRATDDIDWEDPFERLTGIVEVDGLARLWTRWVKSADITVHKEHHAPHEIIMDWTIKSTLVFLPSFPTSIRMRSHILMEPSETKVGDPEKVFRVYEEWGGNPLMNEKTLSPTMLGTIHSKLRKFHGYMITQGIKYGIL